MKSLIKWRHFVILTVFLGPVFLGQILIGKSVGQSETHKPLNSKHTNGPDCSGRWPTNMTFVLLKNAGITDNEKIDFAKTQTTRIASEQIGRDLYHQVYDVVYVEHSGRILEAIAVHDASTEECSMTGVEVFVVSQHLSSR